MGVFFLRLGFSLFLFLSSFRSFVLLLVCRFSSFFLSPLSLSFLSRQRHHHHLPAMASTSTCTHSSSQKEHPMNLTLTRSNSLSRMEFDFDAIEEEDSPFPEVRASVSNIDDPDMPAMTIRMWVVGLLLCMISRSVFFLFFFFWHCGLEADNNALQCPQCILQLPFAGAYDCTTRAFAHLVSVWQVPGLHAAYHDVPDSAPLPPAFLPPYTPAVLCALPAHREPLAATDLPACPGILAQPWTMEHQRTRAGVHHGQRRRREPVRTQRHRRLRGVLRAGDGVLVFADVGARDAADGVWACGALQTVFGMAGEYGVAAEFGGVYVVEYAACGG